MYKIKSVGVFVLSVVVAMIVIVDALDCDEEMCNAVCSDTGGMNGTCKEDSCDCSYGKKCSEMVNLVCNLACGRLRLKGECDEAGWCICKAELELCLPTECYEQCLADPRAAQCEAEFGFVTPVSCLEYGPIKTCGCLCTLPGNDMEASSKAFQYSVKHLKNVV